MNTYGSKKEKMDFIYTMSWYHQKMCIKDIAALIEGKAEYNYKTGKVIYK